MTATAQSTGLALLSEQALVRKLRQPVISTHQFLEQSSRVSSPLCHLGVKSWLKQGSDRQSEGFLNLVGIDSKYLCVNYTGSICALVLKTQHLRCFWS